MKNERRECVAQLLSCSGRPAVALHTTNSARSTYSSVWAGKIVQTAHRFDDSSHFWSSFHALARIVSAAFPPVIVVHVLHCCLNLLAFLLLQLWLSPSCHRCYIIMYYSLRHVSWRDRNVVHNVTVRVGSAEGWRGNRRMKGNLNSFQSRCPNCSGFSSFFSQIQSNYRHALQEYWQEFTRSTEKGVKCASWILSNWTTSNNYVSVL